MFHKPRLLSMNSKMQCRFFIAKIRFRHDQPIYCAIENIWQKEMQIDKTGYNEISYTALMYLKLQLQCTLACLNLYEINRKMCSRALSFQCLGVHDRCMEPRKEKK